VSRSAEVVEAMGGKCFPFGPLEGAFMAATGFATYDIGPTHDGA
jgi:hypothetical protein